MSTVAEQVDVRAPVETVFDCWSCFEGVRAGIRWKP